jgi:IS5 family transposase
MALILNVLQKMALVLKPGKKCVRKDGARVKTRRERVRRDGTQEHLLEMMVSRKSVSLLPSDS